MSKAFRSTLALLFEALNPDKLAHSGAVADANKVVREANEAR